MDGQTIPGGLALETLWARWPQGGAPAQPAAVRPPDPTPSVTSPSAPSPSGPAFSPRPQAVPSTPPPGGDFLERPERSDPESLSEKPQNGDDSRLLLLRQEYLERENALLRERLALADIQLEVKDGQIRDFKALTESLSHQNQVLMMLSQGVPVERILKGGDTAPQPRHDDTPRDVTPEASSPLSPPPPDGALSWPTRGADPRVAHRQVLAKTVRALLDQGLSHRDIAQALNARALPPRSGQGTWDRRKVGKFIAALSLAAR